MLAPELSGDEAAHGPDGFLPWLERHPDQELVARYWRENRAAVQDMLDRLTGRPTWN